MRRRRKESTRTIRTSRLGVYLTPQMYRELTIAAAEEGTSLTALVENLVATYLRTRRRRRRKG